MKGSFRILTISGIEIGIHYTWLLAFFLIAWSLAVGFFPQSYPNWTRPTYWVMGVIASLFLFISVLLHELAHSFVARSRGLPVHSITLFIFGGVSNIEKEPEKPMVEFTMSVVGPLSSLVLAGIFWVFQKAATPGTPLFALLGYLALINLLLAVFNILPGFPLDGGRVLRSIIWGATKSLSKATNVAATTGQVFGWALIAYGVFQILGSNIFGGLWIAFIGWFLASAAETSRREVTLREHLSGVSVTEVMDSNPETISPDTSVEKLVHDVFLQHGRRAAPVCKNDRIVGIITLPDVKGVPQQQWALTPVEKVMTREPIYYVKLEDDLTTALKLISEHSLNQVLVLKEGRLVGLISRADIIRYLQMHQELGIAPKQKPPSAQYPLPTPPVSPPSTPHSPS